MHWLFQASGPNALVVLGPIGVPHLTVVLGGTLAIDNVKDSHGNLQILVSDPHLKFMLSSPKHDARGIADMIKSLISGQEASDIDLGQTSEFSQYTPLLNYYYDMASNLEKI